MHHITYHRGTLVLKVLVSLLFVIVTLGALLGGLGGFLLDNSSFPDVFMYIVMIPCLLFFSTTLIMFSYFLFKPMKICLISFDESGFYYKGEKIPYTSVTSFGYGLRMKKFWTSIFEGFIIETTTKEIVIPTYQLLSNKQVAKWVIEPLERYAPELFDEDMEDDEEEEDLD